MPTSADHHCHSLNLSMVFDHKFTGDCCVCWCVTAN